MNGEPPQYRRPMPSELGSNIRDWPAVLETQPDSLLEASLIKGPAGSSAEICTAARPHIVNDILLCAAQKMVLVAAQPQVAGMADYSFARLALMFERPRHPMRKERVPAIVDTALHQAVSQLICVACPKLAAVRPYPCSVDLRQEALPPLTANDRQYLGQLPIGLSSVGRPSYCTPPTPYHVRSSLKELRYQFYRNALNLT
jgi:hypothetical protein